MSPVDRSTDRVADPTEVRSAPAAPAAAGPAAATRSDPLPLAIEGLSVALPPGADRACAVEDLHLQVAPGEIVCLVGESGSGKSVAAFTAMGLLPAALRPIAGSVRVHGTEIIGAPAEQVRQLRGRHVGMIFQEPMTALNPVLRCGDQIDEALCAHGPPEGARTRRERRARVLQMLADVRLPDPAAIHDAWPHQLSGGQRQRIMIAMALIHGPQLLIADEPTTALDVTTQARVLALIHALCRARGTGVLFITHDFGVVHDIADRVVVLQHGRCVEQGTAASVLSSPQHPYTRALIAAVPPLTSRQRPWDSPDPQPTQPFIPSGIALSERLAPPTLPPQAGPAPVLRVEGLDKIYADRNWLGRSRRVVAVQGVSLKVRRGETVGIVGESGSGKSTLARCVARLIDPTAGRILIDGTDIAALDSAALHPWRQRVQMVFQDPYRSLNPRRTVGQTLMEGPTNYGLSRTEARTRARELLQMVQLDAGALERFPHEFSGGQRQRIAIARALALEPDLLIADEAVSALDVTVQKQIIELLEDIQRQWALSILFITHDLRVAAHTCHRLAVMHEGVIVEQGRTAEVFSHPRHAYTRALLAAAPGAGHART